MIVAGACIAGVADVGDHLALLHNVAFGEVLGVAREVGVVEDEVMVCTELIDGRAAAVAVEELENFTICGSEYGCFSRGGNVDSVVYAAFRARVVEGVKQLIRAHTGDRDDQVNLSDEVFGCGCWSWFGREWRAHSDRITGREIDRGEKWSCPVSDRECYQRHDHQKHNTQQNSKLHRPHAGPRNN